MINEVNVHHHNNKILHLINLTWAIGRFSIGSDDGMMS